MNKAYLNRTGKFELLMRKKIIILSNLTEAEEFEHLPCQYENKNEQPTYLTLPGEVFEN